MDSVKPPTNEVDSQLWHACAGGMVQLPPLNSKIFYFPQGHAEHAAAGKVDFGDFRRIPPYILCRVSAVKFMADPETDEVYANMELHPINDSESDDDGFQQTNNEIQENPTSFAKTLTQSDANNGGGFSVPRYCAETIFPKLDYTADPPVQSILAKDVQGKLWKFRHIYRGTPRRHLLTTGWSSFVNDKKLIAGDSIVFVRANNSDLCVGVRRANKGNNSDSYSQFVKVDDHNNKSSRNPKAKLSSESVIKAAKLAANGDPFEVFYYPRASTPEFFVKASTVKAAMRIQWRPGMRFKMAFETEDSSRISWFMGTIASAQVNDQVRWPNSPWRLLQVTWDEPELLQNVKRVSPWSVELVSNMSAVNVSPFSPPRKKLRTSQLSGFCQLPIPTSIQGARHNSQHGSDNNNNNNNDNNNDQPQSNKIKTFSFGILDQDPLRKLTSKTKETTKETDERVDCLLTIGNKDNTKPSSKKSDDNEKEKKKPMFVLFGQRILTEEQMSERWSADVAAPNVSDGSVVLQNGPVETSSDEQKSELRVLGPPNCT